MAKEYLPKSPEECTWPDTRGADAGAGKRIVKEFDLRLGDEVLAQKIAKGFISLELQRLGLTGIGPMIPLSISDERRRESLLCPRLFACGLTS